MPAYRGGRLAAVWEQVRRWLWRAHDAAGGLGLDVALYGASAAFAGATAAWSTLAPHRTWGRVAAIGYAAATLVALGQLGLRRRRARRGCGPRARAAVAVLTWCAVALLPLLLQAVARAGGRTDRAQEEVAVIENGGQRLLDTGTPYLSRAAIAALPEGERLLGYLPYQPGMALFGLPRALDPAAAWWSDARVWFALVSAASLAAALWLLRRGGASPALLVRALQVATVLPLCALTLATGGDDLPVLGLCLLALAFAARGRPGGCGLAVGAAAALKLFAWPVAVVLGVHAALHGRAALVRYGAGALGVPLLSLLPVLVLDRAGVAENVLRFPLGRGLVESPARSPLPGRLLSVGVPGGPAIAVGLLLAAGAAVVVWLVRRPPASAAAAARVCGAGLLAATLLAPATRFGYLLYPVAFGVWGAGRYVTRAADGTGTSVGSA
jgi:Glycosyltransferase family 87